MKLNDAIKRLWFTFSKRNKPNDTDVMAYNELMLYLQKVQKETIQNNLLFAKLYTFLLTDFAKKFTDLDHANKELNKILAEPFEIRIEFLKTQANHLDIQNYFMQKKVLDPFLKTKTNIELVEIHSRYTDKLPQLNKEDFKLSLENWDSERIKYYLESNINLSIQNYKSHV